MRIVSSIISILFVFAAVLAGLLYWPNSPLPDHHNPLRPLELSAPLSPVTPWKLDRTSENLASCLAILGSEAINRMDDHLFNDLCHIKGRVKVLGAGKAKLRPVETRCATALRLAMWERHVLQPAAAEHLGASVSEIAHMGSYSCREIRTPGGSGGQMSSHATADSIDISGFTLDDGRKITLIEDWHGDTNVAAFLRAAHKGSCEFFDTALGPEFNALHRDHFHLQSNGWGTCR